jgi:hypothetical protein
LRIWILVSVRKILLFCTVISIYLGFVWFGGFGREGRGYFKFLCLVQLLNERRGGKGKSNLLFYP